ncbi:hypothetical protein SAMN02745824_1812 [Parasphingorhabdus marina DSM 22363]|uniref:Uncharacterized protein n=1 Tax=Parasphingorhabdus marina DSM 22363 TaxID=1123272 RepID=A0A1N6DCA6_9SPHN|nr:hypothetical protein [Parasphingorhabdus marina]SIN68458.1 hypothetical protein SAMN02745824_1812 [Parasphingorhabdus marina DSM 22363]
MKLSRRILVLVLAVLVAIPAISWMVRESHSTASTESPGQELDIIAQVGPWPVASRLIGYRGKLWFANSVKGRNHNSADIWSFEPQTGQVRYERHLYSQDAGHPLVYKGLLYWPFEDALQSAGEGVVEVTDGDSWHALTIPNPPIYHTSQLLEWEGGLLAITGTRNAGMQFSDDSGRTWEEYYIHPTPSTHVSRLKEMLVFQGKTYASLKDAKVKRLVKWTGSGFQTVNSWPLNRYFNGLTIHGEGLFAIVGRGREREIWRFDGRRSVRVGIKGPFVDLASDGNRLWVVANDGQLWSSPGGDHWLRGQKLDQGRPVSIQSVAGQIYVAGAGDDGRGIVWGPRNHIIPRGEKPPRLISQKPEQLVAMDWESTGRDIDLMLAAPSTYEAAGISRLRRLIYAASTNGPPAGFFAERFKARPPDLAFSAFGGSLSLRAIDIARASILTGMARAGQADVPVNLLTDPWTSPPNSYEKYFEIELSALRAVAASGQNDRQTVDALLKRLDFADDPPWLKSQIIGTLTSISGKHLGYDIVAWKDWAKSR